VLRAAPRATRRDTILALHRWIAQDIRYVSIALGAGGYVPRTADDVLTTAFGDCKDKATLFIAALRRANIPAYPVLLAIGAHPDARLPSIQQFNHVIAAVDESATTRTFTDLTAELVPYGETPVVYQGTFAVVARANTADTVRVPRAPLSANTIATRGTLALDTLGRLTGAMRERSTGTLAQALRAAFMVPAGRSVQQVAENVVRARFFGANVQVDSVRAFDGRDLLADALLQYSLRLDGMLQSAGELRLLPMRGPFASPAAVYGAMARQLEGAPSRQAWIDNVQIIGDQVIDTDITITLPDGWRAELPKPVVATSFFGSYDARWSQDGRVLRFVRRVQSTPGVSPPQRIAEVIVWLKTLAADPTEFVTLRPPPNNRRPAEH
jgi:hypothetical protein